jgi:hypothetical protein
MYLADREIPRSERGSAKSNGAAPHFKWVRSEDEATSFPDMGRAQMALFFVLGVNDWKGEIVPARQTPDTAERKG